MITVNQNKAPNLMIKLAFMKVTKKLTLFLKLFLYQNGDTVQNP